MLLGSENFTQYFPDKFKHNTVMLPQVLNVDSLHIMLSKKTVSQETIYLLNEAITEELVAGRYPPKAAFRHTLNR